MSFSDLKKQSKLGSLTAKLVKEVEKMNNNASSGDDRLWRLECDKSGNGYAVIHFLPAPNGEDLPFVKIYSHAFQGPGGWMIDQCVTTLSQKCPICEHNSELWNNGTDAGKEIARKQKRKLLLNMKEFRQIFSTMYLRSSLNLNYVFSKILREAILKRLEKILYKLNKL